MYTIPIGIEIEPQVALQSDAVSWGDTEEGGEGDEDAGDHSELVILDPTHVSSLI